VLFAGEATLRSLNARFRGKDRPTDVLSFPAVRPPRPTAWPEGPYLGDLVIGVPVARRNARRHGHSLAREIEMLLLHGYLHLLGYDHERDNGRMERLEKRLRRGLGLEMQAGSPA
jgi:probable rRNA maturation factor